MERLKIFLKNILILVLIGAFIYLLIESNKYPSEINEPISDKISEVELVSCIDGDTAIFFENDKEITVRFLGIDTAEVNAHSDLEAEPYALEASQRTCLLLSSANKILLERQDQYQFDKYGRDLAWVWVDNNLVQYLLVSEGLADTAYLKDDYLYQKLLIQAQKEASDKKIGIWKDE